MILTMTGAPSIGSHGVDLESEGPGVCTLSACRLLKTGD